MENKKKRIIYTSLSMVLSMSFTMGFFALGLIFRSDNSMWNYFAGASIAFFVLEAIATASYYLIKRLKEKKLNVQEIRGEIEKQRAKVQKNSKEVYQNILRLDTLGKLLMTVNILIFIFLAFSMGKTTKVGGDTLSSTPIYILICFGLIGAFNNLFCNFMQNKTSGYNGEYLNEKDYPKFYETARKAAQASGYNGKIYLAFTDDGICIAGNDNTANLGVDVIAVNFLTSDELYQVMLHEFAHLVNKDGGLGQKFCNMINFWDESKYAIFSRIFLGILCNKICDNIQEYYDYATIEHEIAADSAVKQVGNAQTYTNACAKIALFQVYCALGFRSGFNLYEKQEPQKDFYNDLYEDYLKNLALNKEKWLQTLEKEIKYGGNSHPIFKERKEAMGAVTYSVEEIEHDVEYLRECAELKKYGGQKVYDDIKRTYDEDRKQFYTKELESANKYEQIMADIDNFDYSEKIKCAEALLNIDDDKALLLLERLAEKYPDKELINFYIGAIYSKQLDDRCIEHFEKALNNPDCIMQVYVMLSTFLRYLGDQEKYEYYKAKFIADAQQTVNFNMFMNIKNSQELLPCEKSEEIMEVIEYIHKNLKNINKVFMARKQKTDSINIIYMALDVPKKDKEKYNYLNDLQEYLSSREENTRYIVMLNVLANKRQQSIIRSFKNSLMYDRKNYAV